MGSGILMEVGVVKQLLETRRKLLQLQRRNSAIQTLFDMGCGFTEFLTQIFLHLSFEEMLTARQVCTRWKNFIDTQVWHHHPSITWLLNEFPEIQVKPDTAPDLPGTLRYLRILALRSSYPPLRKRKQMMNKAEK